LSLSVDGSSGAADDASEARGDDEHQPSTETARHDEIRIPRRCDMKRANHAH